uniref:GDSL esterase/lipase n=1 Tax=Aegilops tauschii subsp. strangulata TaxID=200361 RepID=A0A453GZW1_AEGTS
MPAASADGCPAGGERASKQGRSRHRREQLWVFGDSYADTGNLGNLGRELTHAWYDPYGKTFPRRPAGRFSDGRVLTDFVGKPTNHALLLLCYSWPSITTS